MVAALGVDLSSPRSLSGRLTSPALSSSAMHSAVTRCGRCGCPWASAGASQFPTPASEWGRASARTVALTRLGTGSMPRPRLRLTIGGMLILVALIAVGVAYFRPRNTQVEDVKVGTG